MYIKVDKNCSIWSPKLLIFYLFRSTSNISCYHYTDVIPITHQCLFSAYKSIKNIQKVRFVLRLRILLNTALAHVLMDDSNLQLYFSKSTRKSQVFTKSTHFKKLIIINFCVLLFKSKVFSRILAIIARLEQNSNCFKA